MTAIKFDYWITTDSFRVLYAVDSSNIKHELRFKSRAILNHLRISGGYFFVCQLEIVSYFLHELKQRSNDITARH